MRMAPQGTLGDDPPHQGAGRWTRSAYLPAQGFQDASALLDKLGGGEGELDFHPATGGVMVAADVALRLDQAPLRSRPFDDRAVTHDFALLRPPDAPHEARHCHRAQGMLGEQIAQAGGREAPHGYQFTQLDDTKIVA